MQLLNPGSDTPDDTTTRLGHARAERLYDAWGRRIPMWQEFLRAEAAGRVNASRRVADIAMRNASRPAPRKRIVERVLYYLGVCFVPITVALYSFGGLQLRAVFSAVVVALLAISVSDQWQCEDIIALARQDSSLYETLVRAGVFEFYPGDY